MYFGTEIKTGLGRCRQGASKGQIIALCPLSPYLMPGGLRTGLVLSPQSGGALWGSVCSLRKRRDSGKLEGRRLDFFFLDIFVLSFHHILGFVCHLQGLVCNGL